MFRPNRVGTPHIYMTKGAIQVTDFDLFTPAIGSGLLQVNGINPTPDGDFGRQQLRFIGAEAVANLTVFGLIQQFTVTKPLAGETIGVEIDGSIVLNAPADALIVPVFGKLEMVAANLMGQARFTTLPNHFNGTVHRSTANAHGAYRADFISSLGSEAVEGVYGHGFMVYATTAYSLTYMLANFSVRQLNDQQARRYRDTLR